MKLAYNLNVVSKKIVVMAHGLGSSKESSTNVSLAKIFNDNGISTLCFDFYGHGESEGSFSDITIPKGVACVKQMLELVKDYNQIGLVGSSFGGICSLLAAAETKVDALALKAPAIDLKEVEKQELGMNGINEWKQKGFRIWNGMKLSYSFYDTAVVGYDADVKSPTLVIHGDCDDVVSVSQSTKLFENLSSEKKLEIIKGANHRFDHHEDEMIEIISTWIIRHL